MKVKPLSKENIEEAIQVAHKVFPSDAKEIDSPERAFRASLNPENDRSFFKEHNMKTLRYFVVCSREKIIGTTGIYTLKTEPREISWLGWFGIDKKYRGKGLGKELLNWTLNKIKEEGGKTVRLYTTTDPNEAKEQKIY